MHFEQMRGNHLGLGLDLARRHRSRGARYRRRARAVGTEPIRRGVGIALLDGDVVGDEPELGRDDLGVGGFVALALRLGAEARDHTAGGMNADLGGVEHRDAEDVAVARRPGTDDLGEERNADAHQLPGFAASERLLLGLLLGPQLCVSDCIHRFAVRRRDSRRNRIPSRGLTCTEIARGG